MPPLDSPFMVGAEAVERFYERIDEARRVQRRMVDASGFGPQETPSHVVLRKTELTLKANRKPFGLRSAILMVLGPIKRAYIWDLTRGASVVKQCLKRSARPYRMQREERQENLGLANCCDRAYRDAIHAKTSTEELFPFRHSLGGLFTAILIALHTDAARRMTIRSASIESSGKPR